MKDIKQLIKKSPLLAFFAAIVGRIIPGYLQYRKLIKKFGKDITILRTAWHGTGDYYICGMYLHEYLRMHEVSTYVFLVNDKGSEAKVTDLFHIYQGHVLQMHSVKCLSRFSEFMWQEEPICKSFECSDHLTFVGENLKGYHGLTLMDFYLYYGFGYKKEPVAYAPCFSDNICSIKILMREKGLISGKTVLLSPYSTCSKSYLPSDTFWEHIVVHLLKLGYTVATNCFGKEAPIRGTISLSMTYSDVVPFLDEAGGFIGIRSGLCDITSRSSCHKIIIHTEKSDYWPEGRSEAYVGLRAMGLSRLADELTYSGDEIALETKIIPMIDIWTE